MIPNMKFYVISIVSIFAALGIGIYIGFSLDAQSFVLDQREDIALKLEERFDFQKEENNKLKKELEELGLVNKNNEIYISSTYNELIKNKMNNKTALIIETNSDYIYSGTGTVLEDAGAKVTGILTVEDQVIDEEKVKAFYEDNNLEAESQDLRQDLVLKLSKSLLEKDLETIEKLREAGFINYMGDLKESIDTVVLAGGSLEKNQEKMDIIDKNLISSMLASEINIVGVEKENVNNSYMDFYKNSKISTVDNVDTSIGKVSLINALGEYPGHYGVKPSADALVPMIDSSANVNK